MARLIRVPPFGTAVPAGRAVSGREWSQEVLDAVKNPERTGYRVGSDLAGDYTFQEWPNRASLLKTLELQRREPSRPGQWRPFVKGDEWQTQSYIARTTAPD